MHNSHSNAPSAGKLLTGVAERGITTYEQQAMASTQPKTSSSNPGPHPQKYRRTPPDSEDSPGDSASKGPGEAYLSLFGPPALANTADTYFQSFAVLRAILEGAPKHHAHAVLDAAEDVAENHVDRRLAGGGQQG